jgi:hypothetical protein
MMSFEVCESCNNCNAAATPLEVESWLCYYLIGEGERGWVCKNDNPPEGCPKIFEHAVAAGMTNVEG